MKFNEFIIANKDFIIVIIESNFNEAINIEFESNSITIEGYYPFEQSVIQYNDMEFTYYQDRFTTSVLKINRIYSVQKILQ
jgi:hypothetical protein